MSLIAVLLAIATTTAVAVSSTSVTDETAAAAVSPTSLTEGRPPADAPYRNAALPIAQRVADLLSRMTLAEKGAQLLNPVGDQDGPGHFSVNASYILSRWGATGLGTVYSGFACNSSLTGAACHNFLQSELMARSRLGIPVSVISETLVAGAGGATIFPQPVLRGCAFDLALEGAIGASIARQARLGGTDRGLSPVLQVDTDARFGRFEEAYGEDPFLVAEMGVAVATALQGDASGPTQYLPDSSRHITCEAKHYMAYGYGGRDWFAADLSNRTLFDTYGKPWHRFMRRAGGRGAMVAHPGVNGLPLHGSRFMLTDVLRNWFGAGGNGEAMLIASDWGNVDGIASFGVVQDAAHAAMLSVWAGLDNSMCPPPGAMETIIASAAAGLIGMAYVDRAAGNNLRQKFAAGLFDGAAIITTTPDYDLPAERALAHRAALEGVVLLQNGAPSGGGAPLLPLRGVGSAIKSVALLGPLAGCLPGEHSPCLAQQGMGGHYTQYGARIVTLLDALNGSGLALTHLAAASIGDYNESGIAAAVAAAAAADLTLVAVGDSIDINTGSCSEMSDADTIDLPGSQLALLDALAAAGRPLVVVLFNCRPATFGAGPFSRFGANNALLARLPAVVAAWRPGEEAGAAVWELLTGAANPSGRLTQNWVRNVGAVKSPASPYNQVRGNLNKDFFTEPASPLFPFGHGLSYSNFSVSGVTLSPAGGAVGADDVLTVSGAAAVVDGGAAGELVLHAYFSQNSPTKWSRWERALCGFTRVAVPAGGAPAPFSLTVRVRDFDAFEPDTGDFEVQSGSYTLVLATDAASAARAPAAGDQATRLVNGMGASAIASFQLTVNGTYTWKWDFST